MAIQTFAVVLGMALLLSSAAVLAWGFPRLPPRAPRRATHRPRH